MNKLITALLLSVFFSVNALSAAVNLTSVTSTEFDSVFDYGASKPVSGSEAVWYAQFQAGFTTSTENTFEQWEIEIGDINGATDYGHTSWAFQETYDFNVSYDNSANVTASFNGAGAGDGLPVINAFNEIWIELRVDTGDPLDTINVSNHQIDTFGLSNMSVSGSTSGNSVRQAFKFYFDDRTSNIGSFDLLGDMYLDVAEIGAVGQSWTYTVIGVNNSAIPEPSYFLMGLLVTLFVFTRRKFH